ncbi:phospholipid-binding protein MlaC [Paracoccus panacisoli]|uniref:ABC transporter n=2 Tax=Paracoccus TaxID=265 RepID=A0A099GDH1_9RHOB|nr:ABC transporter substrate-binding protein [Paracoccus sanguinis]KGJ11117.1 ABC transporter [Paracoccus sanguinis]KGJ20766.1 ABC transporter [Paracoccus sanguinis]QJD16208.1 ABC transporter substrate-binding protein [Paracoccus sanguinis]
MPIETRRGFLGLMATGALAVGLPAMPAWAALSAASATAAIQRAVDEVFAIINAGTPPAEMYRRFEGVFTRHADVDAIARSALGPAARGLDPATFGRFKQAMTGYIARKYGKRFREFIGSKIEVGGAKPVKSFWSVSSTAYLNGRSPMQVDWHISDKTGQPRFFNLIIEGVNMLASEREEIGAMLARRKGDLNGLIADLQQAG